MLEYRPDKFIRTFEIYKGVQFWEWLNQPQIITIMKTACYLRRPAVEAIAPLLEQAFETEVHRVKVRQMIGHMVRQILESEGYHLHRANVRINSRDNPFLFGSAYTRFAA
ncbi:hypothetical protein [Neptunicoccus cionae]|uniref:Uncharacterized protein n=1 Tax=Neptunicoccus cionae TaxID=2035344 RepID=A0A916VR71_9RHOB|nr:hypothetical protein [Amylibacter cionae]GGA23295.1 hypothetical protein GCM10011498_25190 [Amylibacter cionae]